MKYHISAVALFPVLALAIGQGALIAQETSNSVTGEIRTPKPPAMPRINGPGIFGVRPGQPFLYRVPAIGDRPMEFSVSGLPDGLKIDPKTGQITGSLPDAGEHRVHQHRRRLAGCPARPPVQRHSRQRKVPGDRANELILH